MAGCLQKRHGNAIPDHTPSRSQKQTRKPAIERILSDPIKPVPMEERLLELNERAFSNIPDAPHERQMHADDIRDAAQRKTLLRTFQPKSHPDPYPLKADYTF